MITTTRWGVWLCAALICCGRPTASEAARPSEVRRAKALFKQGTAEYKRGAHARALERFERALKLDRRPSTILNIAQCHRQLGHPEQALAHFKLYLEEHARSKPGQPAPFEDEVKGQIAALGKQLEAAAQPKRTPERAEPTPLPRPSLPPTSGALPDPVASRPSPAAMAPPEPGNPPPRSRWKRTAGWIALGAGLASLGTGVAFGALVKSKSDAYLEGGRTKPEADALKESGQRYQSIELATLVVGGALAAAGAGLVIWDLVATRRGRDERALRIAPTVGATGAGLIGVKRF